MAFKRELSMSARIAEEQRLQREFAEKSFFEDMKKPETKKESGFFHQEDEGFQKDKDRKSFFSQEESK